MIECTPSVLGRLRPSALSLEWTPTDTASFPLTTIYAHGASCTLTLDGHLGWVLTIGLMGRVAAASPMMASTTKHLYAGLSITRWNVEVQCVYE